MTRRPVVGVIGSAHLMEGKFRAQRVGERNLRAVADVTGALPLIFAGSPEITVRRPTRTIRWSSTINSVVATWESSHTFTSRTSWISLSFRDLREKPDDAPHAPSYSRLQSSRDRRRRR